ncbi:hypothetical protein ACHAP5_003165 [Fusarium lateritium]
MKFLPIAAAFFAAFAIAAPSTEGELERRQCSCKKVGNEWLCGGPKCPRDLPSKRGLERRQCSCKKVGGEWICSGSKCPRDLSHITVSE